MDDIPRFYLENLVQLLTDIAAYIKALLPIIFK